MVFVIHLGGGPAELVPDEGRGGFVEEVCGCEQRVSQHPMQSGTDLFHDQRIRKGQPVGNVKNRFVTKNMSEMSET